MRELMKKNLTISMLCIGLFLTSCLSQLEEDVRTQVTDSYLSTSAGFNEAVNASYASLKSNFCALEDVGIIRY